MEGPHRVGRRAALSILMVACVGPPGGALDREPSAPEWEALSRGAILVSAARNSDGTQGVDCLLLVAGNRDRIYTALEDPLFFKRQYPSIEQLSVLRSYDNGADVEYVVRALIKDIRYTVARTYDRATYTISWHRISGDLRSISGSWKVTLSPFPGKLLVEYQSFVDPGPVVGRGLYIFVAQRQAQLYLAKLRHILETQG